MSSNRYTHWLGPAAAMAGSMAKRKFFSAFPIDRPIAFKYPRRGFTRTAVLRRKKKTIGNLDVGVKSGGPATMLRLPYGYGLPDKYQTTDQGMYQVLATDAAGFRNIQLYANSVWHVDPATTDTRNYARLASIYRKYRVYASSIRVTVVNADDAHPVTCVVTPSTDAAISTEELASTNNLAKATVCTQYAGKEIVHHYVNMRKLIGPSYNDDENSAAIGAHPAVTVNWHVQLFGDTVTPTALNCHVYIFYSMSVLWTDKEST